MNGGIKLFNYREVPVYLHWSVFLLVLLFIGKPDPLITIPVGLLGYTIIILVHEIGHAFFIKYYGYRVASIEIFGLNGLCSYETNEEASNKILIPAGGLLFQAVLLVFG